MDHPTPLDPADPLAQPTRARLFDLLTDLRRPATTEELAERGRIHANSVRGHLARLSEAGLVERLSVPGPRGRPHHEWRISPQARPAGARPVAYEDLSGWLARIVAEGRETAEQVEAAGAEIGRELAPSGGPGGVVSGMETALSAMGFQPATRVAEGRAVFQLGNCPYRNVAVEQRSVVCALHEGLARGLTEALGGRDARLSGFAARDPRKAGCLIELEIETETKR